MGIRGLQTYIERDCPSHYCCYEVSIEQLVNDYKKETGLKPVIVFDGELCMDYIYRGLDWVSGGQYKECIDKIGKFIQAFKNLGVDLVFFFGGGCASHKRQWWIKRNSERLEKVYQFFNYIKCKTDPNELSESMYNLPPRVSRLSQYYLEHIFGCEVHQAVDEKDAEVADYARKRSCFAIFAQDTDYLIYEGAAYYLSARHFNIDTMKTMCYNRKKLASHLGLRPSQLPLFAILAGNGVVSSEELEPFHRRICRKKGIYHIHPSVLFPGIANYIRQVTLTDDVFEVLPEIALETLRDANAATKMETTIRSYLSCPKNVTSTASNYPQWDAILKKAEELHRANYNASNVFSILNGAPFETSTAIEDYRKKDLPPSARLLRPMRERIYGILFHEKPSDLEPQVVLEWCVEGSGTFDKPLHVTPVPPSDPHPGLLALWSQDRSEESQHARWQLFTHAISPKLNQDKLMDLPDHLLLPTCVLFYIQDNQILEPWEIEALIGTVITLHSIPVDKLAKLPSNPVDSRAVQIATIYIRTLRSIIILLGTCGYPFPQSKAFMYPYFDGKLFQQKYHKTEDRVSDNILREDQVANVNMFEQVKQILFGNPA